MTECIVKRKDRFAVTFGIIACLFLISLVFLTISSTVSDADYQYDPDYTVNDGSCFVYDDTGKRIVKFNDSSDILYVYIPDGVETIGEGAFKDAHIFFVQLPSSVKYVEKDAFKGCYGITRIQIDNVHLKVETDSFALGDEKHEVYCDVYFPECDGGIYGKMIEFGTNSYTHIDYCLLPAWPYDSNTEECLALTVFFLNLTFILGVCYFKPYKFKNETNKKGLKKIDLYLDYLKKENLLLCFIPMILIIIASLVCCSITNSPTLLYITAAVSLLGSLIIFITRLNKKPSKTYITNPEDEQSKENIGKELIPLQKAPTEKQTDSENERQVNNQQEKIALDFRYSTIVIVCWTFIGFLVTSLISVELDHSATFIGQFYSWGTFTAVLCLLPALLLTHTTVYLKTKGNEDEIRASVNKIYMHFLMVIGTCVSGIAILASASKYISASNQVLCFVLSILIVPIMFTIFVVKYILEKDKDNEETPLTNNE